MSAPDAPPWMAASSSCIDAPYSVHIHDFYSGSSHGFVRPRELVNWWGSTRTDHVPGSSQRSLTVPGSVIVAGARTPIGKMQGAFAALSAADLGGIAIKAALERAGLSPEAVEYVIMGQVLLAGAGQLPARQAAVKAGIPMSVPATIVNKVCLSGLNSIYQADLLIAAGEA